MMKIKPGTLLISAPSLEDANFEKAVIVIAEHNEKGALGFVINKLFTRRFNELLEFKNSPPVNLYAGGPVETESLFFLHRRADLIEDSTALFDSVYMGGNFTTAVQLINDTIITGNDVKLFIGYCGWDDNELEEEIAEGSWLITDASAEIIFAAPVEMLWQTLYEKSV